MFIVAWNEKKLMLLTFDDLDLHNQTFVHQKHNSFSKPWGYKQLSVNKLISTLISCLIPEIGGD